MWFDIWQLLGGVGLLIFGMSLLEHALYSLWGNKLKHYLQHYTSSMRLAVPVGLVTTMLMGGSGDLVTLLTMAMFSAGLIPFRSSLGIIFWSNIGATSLPLIVSFFGFGGYDFGHIVLPLIAIGGVALIILKSEKSEQIAKAMIWFSLLFVAIEWMSQSITTSGFDISQYKDMSLWWFGLLGSILAMVIQSGGAIGIITLTGLKEGLITFPASIAIMMWVNIGTTNTPFLGALGGKREKVQIAVSHVLFNVISGIIGVVFFWQYIRIGQMGFNFTHNESLSSAVINFIFNSSTAILFACFVSQFEWLVKKCMPGRTNDQLLEVEELQNQTTNSLYTLPFAIAYRKDTRTFVKEVIDLTDSRINERILTTLTNQTINTERYTLEKNELAITKAKKLLGIGVEFQRTSKHASTINLLDQCTLSIRQCYRALELIQRTDKALQNNVVRLPENAQYLKQKLNIQLTDILQVVHRICANEDGEPAQHIDNALRELKQIRIDVLKELVKNASEEQQNDETISEMIIFTQRLYQIIKKLLAALHYSFLLKSEQEIAEHELD